MLSGLFIQGRPDELRGIRNPDVRGNPLAPKETCPINGTASSGYYVPAIG